MLSRFSLLLLILLALAAPGLTGCAARQKMPPPSAGQSARADQRVGEVKAIRNKLGFALLDVWANVTPGLKLYTIDPATQEETATLTVSPQRSPPFFLGDITSGAPKAGDIVMLPAGAHSSAVNTTVTILPPGAPAAPVPSGPVQAPSDVPTSLPPIPDLEPLPQLAPIPDLPPL